MGMTRFIDWRSKHNLPKATAYRSGVVITKIGRLSYVTDEDDAAWQAKLPKVKTSRLAADVLQVAECSVKRLAELVADGKVDRDVVAARLSAILKQTGI